MTDLVTSSIRTEFLRYKALAEGAIRQLDDADLSTTGPEAANSVATVCWHVAGNLQSRFTDFLTADGEKPWRHREEEFQARTVTHAELSAKWTLGWDALLSALDGLDDGRLEQVVTIRGQGMRVIEALHRALAHVSYHVGQIVYIAKALRGRQWTYLSIPPGQSDTYNQAPSMERPADHAARLSRQDPPS